MADPGVLCAAAVSCFSFSGALIMRLPRADRRTLFIFPIFLSVVIGGSLTVFGYQHYGAWMVGGPLLIPVLFVLSLYRATRPWLLTVLSYVFLAVAIVCTDYLLEGSPYR